MNQSTSNQTAPLYPDMGSHDVVSGHLDGGIPEQHRARGVLIAIGVILGVGLIGFAVWFFFFRIAPRPKTPEQALAGLEKSSAPVTTTTTERLLEIKDLKKGVPQKSITADQRAQMMQQLN